MFKLESYIAPLLMSYINKYVKLQQDDFTLSLWGGDLVLNKLDLRLDAIESALNLPITFKSGHIYELRIHVPWSRLGSEPVVITINTIECILRLKDASSEDGESTGGRSASSASRSAQGAVKPKVKRQDTEDLPPGYLQSLVNRIVNNANIVINNLILKFVEDDIVLSVNVKSAECYSVNQDWNRAFVELSMPELVLRRVFDFHDLTVCLDRRNASGKIEAYQDPLLYRCSLTCRIHMTHDSINSKLPSCTRFNLLCEQLDLSLTDTQLPMFCRLVELVVALYYGTLQMPGSAAPGDDNSSFTPATQDLANVDVMMVDGHQPNNQEGWASWAWSYVPQILPSGEEEDGDESGPRRKPQLPVLSLGFYIKQASLAFKLTETVMDGPTYAGSSRLNFVPCMLWEASGITLDVLIRGLVFFNVQFGVTGGRMTSQGDAMCGVSDLGTREPCFMKSGSCIEEKAHPLIGFMTGSLFDPGGAENQGERPAYIFEEDKHLQRYTETFALIKYGSFWMDYLYTMEEREEGGDGHSSNASQSQGEENLKENSTLRFLFGPLHVIVSSSMVQRLHKFVYCMGCHDYEPYSRTQKEIVDESRAPPTEEQVRHMEEYTPTRTYHVTMTKPVMWLLANDLPAYDVRKRKVLSQRKAKKAKSKPNPGPSSAAQALPGGVFQAERIDLQLTSAMYPRKQVQLVSKMAAPSSNLLHHCHGHTYLKVFGVQAGLSRRETSGKFAAIQNIIQPWSGAYYKRSLLYPMYWKNSLQARQECMYELPHLTLNLTKPQLLLILHTALTWGEPDPTATPAPAPTHTPGQAPHSALSANNTSLMDDVFKNVEVRTSRKRPVLEVSVSGVEVRDCVTPAVRAVTGTLTATQAMVIHVDAGHDSITPIMYGPLDTTGVSTHNYFKQAPPPCEMTSEDFITFTVQLPKTPDMPAAPAVLRLDVRGMATTIDPILYDWMRYAPTPLKSAHPGQQSPNTLDAPLVNIDTSLAESSSPLIKSQGSQSESGRTQPTDAQTASRTAGLSATKPTTEPATDQNPAQKEEGEAQTGKEAEGWPHLLAHHFPLVKIMEVQVDVRTCCLFLPSRHVRLAEVTMDIPRTLAAAFVAGSLPETLVVCCPTLHLHSAGHKGTTPAVAEIPIRTLDQSVSGEKLPWSVALTEFSVYTLHPTQRPHYLVRPARMSATVAVTTKYHPPTSDTITSLGLCVHADMDAVITACSHRQIQQLYDLGVAMLSASTKLVTSVTAQIGTVTKPHTTPAPTEPVRPTLTSSPIKAAAHIPTMSTSSQLDPPVTITGTSDTASRETTPVRDLEDTATVKLSLWIQWTVPKFVYAIYSIDDSGRDMRVVTEIEDVATSIDVQDVYSKVKVKVGMLNVSHEFNECEEGKWQSGDHEGVLLTCSDRLNQNVVIVSNKTWSSHPQPIPNLFTDSHGDAKPRDKSHGFLTVTFTRALRKNVKKRMKKMAAEGFLGDDLSSSANGKSVYLNELCVNLQPCDFVVNCPVLSHVMKVFAWRPASDVPGGERIARPTPHDNTSTEEASQSPMPLFTTSLLPLIYINTSNLRMLFPKIKPGVDGSDLTSERKAGTSPHDVLVAHLRALTLTPIADNPLPRIVLEKEVYRRALHAGMTQQPGSEVEDRQYQLDIAGLSLSTGRWRDLVVDKQMKEEENVTVQHPALEWNNLMRQRIEKEEIRLTPVVTAFDLRVVAAPAIVYRPVTPQGAAQPLLVCGHSLEVNATSDIDFYLSNLDVKLALDVFSTNMAALLGAATVRKVDGGSGRWDRNIDDRREDGAQIDSGVDSETSTCVTGFQRVPAVIMTSPEPEVSIEESSSDISNIVPFDVLLTAGKLSFTTYMHQTKQVSAQSKGHLEQTTVAANNMAATPKSKANLEIKVPAIPGMDPSESLFLPVPFDNIPQLDPNRDIELESTLTTADSGIDLESQSRSPEGQPGSGEGESGGEVTEEVVYVVPFLYGTFSQPHSMLKVERTAQKLELSCYDVVLKGAKPGHTFREEQRVIPDVMDYAIHWIETKAGEVNPKTGIPPSLYTIRATDFLLGPADLLLRIERPLKVNVSITRAEQVMTYIRDLMPYFSDLLPTKSASSAAPPHESGKTLQTPEPPSVAPSVLTRLRCVQVDTVQAVMYLDTRPDPHSPTVQLSVSDIKTRVGITAQNTGAVQAIDFNLNLGGLLLKTGYAGTLRPLLGPLALSLGIDANWTTHSGPAHIPGVLCCLETGLVPVTLGQEHILCLQLIAEHVFQFVQELVPPSPSTKDTPKKETPAKDTPKALKPYDEPDLQASVDDLRAGDFEYNTVDSSPDFLPRPNEIVFSVDGEEGHATMTWCYPEPRVVTFLHVTPVPFTLPHQALDTRFIDEDLKVPCILQCWNGLCRDFEDYATFNLSQSEAVSVPLREVTSSTDPELVAAQVWRVLILHPQDKEPSAPTETEEIVEPVVSPMTLAASLRVDSCFSASLVPILQLAVSATSIQFTPAIHYRHLPKEVPSKLQPYSLDSSFFNHDHEFAIITVENPTLTMSHVTGRTRRVTVDVNASVQCDVIEYRNLTMRPLLENVDIMCGATWQLHTEQTQFRLRGEVGPVYVRVGEGAVHTLNAASRAYAQLSSPSGCCVLPHYYLICNNTREVVRIAQESENDLFQLNTIVTRFSAQAIIDFNATVPLSLIQDRRLFKVGTDEEVTIASHQVAPYGWRSHKIQQLLQLTVEGFGGQWSDPVNIDKEGSTICDLEHKGQKVTVIVKVKAISGIQKQVEIAGLLLVASRLTQHLEVKLVRTKDDKPAEGAAMLGSGSSLPSYIIDPDRVCAVRVKLFGLKTVWSQEITVTGEKAKDSRLIKVPLADKGSFIHVWCHVFTETHHHVSQSIVLFVPLFTVRAHFPAPLLMNVETPRLKSSRREELKGQGHEEHMFMVGGDMTHNITFQLSASQQPSSPPIALSSGMIEQVPRHGIEQVKAEQLLTEWAEDLSQTWPYNDIENIISAEPVKSPLSSPTESRPVPQQEVVMAVPPGEDSANQPNIDLQISLRQRWAGCNTLLIDIAPYWTMVNATHLELVIIENNEQQWRLAGKQTFAPPIFDGPFRLGLVLDNRLHLSTQLTLSEQEMTFRYLQGQEDTLYNQGHLKVTIPVVFDQKVTQVCYLTLHSVTSHTMRVVTIRETYVFSNHLGHHLNLQAFSLPLSQYKVPLDHDSVKALECKTGSASKDKDTTVPIPLWHRPLQTSDSADTDMLMDVTYVQYLSLQRADGETTPWALPCRIRMSDQGSRLSMAVPLGGSPYVTVPGVLTVHQRAGIVYLMLAEELDPAMEIHNNCGFTIAYGQALMGVLHAEDKIVQEEAELTTAILSVPPGGSAFYTFPACNSHYPQVSALPETPKLHLAGCPDQSEGRGEKLLWSLGLDLECEHDMFVNIPDVSDAKVHTEKVGHTLHVFIDPVSRAEISAKEIRSRIKGKQTTVVVEGKRQKTPEPETTGSEQQPSVTEVKKPTKRKPLHPVLTELVVVCTSASFILLDEGSNPKVASELLRVTADKVAGVYFPVDLYDPFQQQRPHLTYTLCVTCSDLQVDNQMYTSHTYDFPVVFKQQTQTTEIDFDEAFFQLSPKKQFSKLKQTSLVTLDMAVCTDLTARVSSLTGVTLSLRPVTVFVEDTFIYDIVRRLDRFMNVSLHKRPRKADAGIVIPSEVLCVCSSLTYPVRLQHIRIEPVSILLSVHASLKLFIASDNTPLSFSQFERTDLFTNAPQLLRAAAMHYASGTLYRAGWVVGSLEILGNPTGLVRNVGIGISDMFRMPYQGLTQGPGAFVGGVTRGMGSLVRHISTGAVTSVTNFASSVSRNMDRLSLDSVHRARQEEGRRHKPRGVSDGLLNGLSGFGISLLGAVAGIADQPLQTLTGGRDASTAASPARQATGLVSGVGKGLVGAITKPIGGAAELVSQTGLGLLQGTGLTRFPEPRHAPIVEPSATAPSSTLKVIEKLLATVPNAEVLVTVDALSVDNRSATLQQQQVSLLLTQEILFIVNTADDTPLQAYAVSEISCHGNPEDASLLAVTLGSKTASSPSDQREAAWAGRLHEGALPEEQMNNKDRVAAFLGGATRLGHLTEEDQSQSSSACVHSNSPLPSAQHEFHVDTQTRCLFLTHFTAAKRKATGVGFPV